MEVSDEDPAYMEKFKTAFKKDLSKRKAKLKMASALYPRFKDLKYLPRRERKWLWTSIEALLLEEPSRVHPGSSEEPEKMMRSLLLLASVSDSDDKMGPEPL